MDADDRCIDVFALPWWVVFRFFINRCPLTQHREQLITLRSVANLFPTKRPPHDHQKKYIADFHIHSHYSRATSKQLTPEYQDYWTRIMGIQVVGTGNLTHPEWLAELKEKLGPAKEGLFRLKESFRAVPEAEQFRVPESEVRLNGFHRQINVFRRQSRSKPHWDSGSIQCAAICSSFKL